MTESQYLAFIRSALRSKWLRWKPRSDAFLAARRKSESDNKKLKWEFQCSLCSQWFCQKDCECDHYPKDAGSILSVQDIGQFCENLFCETDNLRICCKPCHSAWTYASANGISVDEAKLQKEVIAICKKSVKDVKQFCYDYGYTDAHLSNPDKRRSVVEEILRSVK
jgi:hypothetical protein